METRQTAKALIYCPGQTFLFVAGKRGIWNLPGGGIDPGETALRALLREADEEVQGLSACITPPVETFSVQGPTTHADGTTKTAHWRVFQANLLVPAHALVIAAGSEITDITTLTPQECLAHTNMSALAQMAVRTMLQSAQGR